MATARTAILGNLRSEAIQNTAARLKVSLAPRFMLSKRLHNPAFRFCKDNKIVGFGVVEPIGSAPMVEATWKWSKRLLDHPEQQM